jgi:maltoporin
MKIKLTLVAAAALSVLSTGASAVDWGGYFRIGPGQKQTPGGDDSRCFSGGAQGGKGGIGRLGNECDTYGEFALSQGAKAGGVDYKAVFMTNLYRPGSDPDGQTIGINQLYMEGKGYNIAPNQTFWAGRRFYGRADVHMDDTFFVNMSGSGAGVDGIALGPASLNVAVFRKDDNGAATNPGTRLNLDFTNIPVNPNGTLRVSTVFTSFSGAGGKSGAGLSLQHNQSGIFGGNNTLWLQYTQGSAYLDQGFGGGTDDSGKKRWRIVESPSWTNGPLTAQGLLQIGEDKNPNGDKQKFSSIAGRVAFALTTNFKIQGELGTSSMTPVQGANSQKVTKFTIAPTLTVGPNYYDRPELRLYVSGFNFNNAYQVANGLTKSSKTAVGIQAEMWF